MTRRLLVANRGEIAVRIIRAARDLGIETVAVYSSVDAESPHVSFADSAVEIGPGAASDSYLSIEAVLAAGRSSRVDAIHPGYGFLSERAEFAAACEAGGFIFVGPPSGVIQQMGDKVEARGVALRAGIPTVPGSEGPIEQVEDALSIANEIGYPVLLKAAGGGGGGGIRRVDDPSLLRAQFSIATQEATAAFGDPRVYLEKFIERSRHVEVQILGDGTNVVHLLDRECSLQRRRQKMVEEALSPGISNEMREAMTAAAVSLAASVGYSGAGTVEFIVDKDSSEFFFIEMNTRIQVEHATTELVCGVDLVAAQLGIAFGDGLGIRQDEVSSRGWAIELRICAEDPSNGFRPNPGRITDLCLPQGPWVRVDTWVEAGTVVSPYYDSLLAKLVVLGEDRESAIYRSRRALREFQLEGICTTIPMLRNVLEQQWFLSGDFDTRTLERFVNSGTSL